jgi:hypothetical protein
VTQNRENSKQTTPDKTDLNQNMPCDVAPKLENSKEPAPDITNLNQDNLDGMKPNREIKTTYTRCNRSKS